MAERTESSGSEKMRGAALGEGVSRRASPWLVLFGTSLSLFLLLGACLCGGAWWLFRPVVRADPVRAEELVPRMVSINIPPAQWMAKGTIEWNLAFMFQIQGVYYQRRAGDGLLAIVQVQSRMSSAEDVKRHIRQTLLTEGIGDSPITVDASKTQTRHTKIQGQDVKFTFETATDPPRVFHLVEGVFPGRPGSGDLLLSLRLPEDEWNEAEVLQLLESIEGAQPFPREAPATTTN